MNSTAASQIALDNALVPPEARLKIGECNRRIEFSKPQREATYQVTLDALKLSPCYLAFLITARVPKIYMQQFWNIVTNVKDSSSYQFKLDNKKFRVNAKVFCDILHIFPKLPNKPFDIPPFTNEEIVSFIYELEYTGNIKTQPELFVDHMHQPWRTFTAVINRMTDKEKKSTMKGFATNDQADYYSWITSITVNEKNSYELKGKFLDDLHKSAFNGTNGEDATEHIKYFLKVVVPIDLPNVNQDKLIVVVLLISLVGDAWRWYDEIKG
nr:hypothetical protein [Tanacetum cinerariifolium]